LGLLRREAFDMDGHKRRRKYVRKTQTTAVSFTDDHDSRMLEPVVIRPDAKSYAYSSASGWRAELLR
jgi:hypothetical protein